MAEVEKTALVETKNDLSIESSQVLDFSGIWLFFVIGKPVYS